MDLYLQPETTEVSPVEGIESSTVSGNGTGGTAGGNEGDPDTGDLGGAGDSGSAAQPPATDAPPPADATTPSSPAASEFMSDVLGSLEAIGKNLDSAPSYDSLAESVRSLVDVMTLQAEEEAEAAGEEASLPVPLADYTAYAYPVTVTYRLYPSGLASETEAVETYGTPEDFVTGYNAMRGTMEEGALSWFSILSVKDAEGNLVYESGAVAMDEESPDMEEPDTFREDVLSALDTLHDDLQSVSANDLGYYGDHLELEQQTLDLHEQYLELQQENRELSYHMLACDIATGFVLLFALGYTIAHGFFQRMKAG